MDKKFFSGCMAYRPGRLAFPVICSAAMATIQTSFQADSISWLPSRAYSGEYF